MPVDIDGFSKFLAAGVESAEGTPAPLLKLFRTRNLEPAIYEGDSKKREYDGDDGRKTPTVLGNSHNSLSFDMDFAGSGDAAVVPEIDALLRMCGMLRVDNDTAGFDYLIGGNADVPSGTLQVRRVVGNGANAGESRYYRYPTTGARGYFGIDIKAGEDPLFQFRNFMGNYVRPLDEQVATIDVEFTNQAAPAVVSNENTPIAILNNTDVCLHAFSISNYSGFEVQRVNAVGCSRTRLKPVSIDGSMTIKETDWTSEFHIYELVESHQAIQTVPFQLQHGTSAGNINTIEAGAMQIHGVKDVELSDGALGKELQFTILDKPVLTMA